MKAMTWTEPLPDRLEDGLPANGIGNQSLPSPAAGNESPAAPRGALARLLTHLLIEARHNIAYPLASQPPGDLVEALDAMARAAATMWIGRTCLGNILWTRRLVYWNGEMASTLERPGAQGFLLLVAWAIGGNRLFFRRGNPLQVAGSIEGAMDASGPHLVLLRCAYGADGKAFALEGAAQAIESARSFMPVMSPFERDIYYVLRALQVRLDCHGIDCAITRGCDKRTSMFAPSLLLEASGEGMTSKSLRLDLPASSRGPIKLEAAADHFPLGADSLGDGRFMAWLVQVLGFKATRP